MANSLRQVSGRIALQLTTGIIAATVSLGLAFAVLIAPADEPFWDWSQYAARTGQVFLNALPWAFAVSVMAFGAALITFGRDAIPLTLGTARLWWAFPVTVAWATARWFGGTYDFGFSFHRVSLPYLSDGLVRPVRIIGSPLSLILVVGVWVFAVYCGMRAADRWLIALARGACARCDYDLYDLPVNRCPECGVAITSEDTAEHG